MPNNVCGYCGGVLPQSGRIQILSKGERLEVCSKSCSTKIVYNNLRQGLESGLLNDDNGDEYVVVCGNHNVYVLNKFRTGLTYTERDRVYVLIKEPSHVLFGHILVASSASCVFDRDDALLAAPDKAFTPSGIFLNRKAVENVLLAKVKPCIEGIIVSGVYKLDFALGTPILDSMKQVISKEDL